MDVIGNVLYVFRSAKMSNDKLTVEEFLGTVMCEGLSYAVTWYYSPETLATLENNTLRDAAIVAGKSMRELEEIVDILLEEEKENL